MATNEATAPKRTAIKQAARAGWLILSRTLAMTAFGLLLNWALFAALGLNVWSRYCPVGNYAPHVSSGAAAAMAVLILTLACSRAILLTALFLFVFPFLYFMAGKARGIKSAIASLTSDNREWIHDRLKPVLQSALEKFRTGPELGEDAEAEAVTGTRSGRGRAKSMAAFVSKRLDQAEGLPRPLRWLIKGILKKLKVARLIEEMNALKKKNGGSDEAVTAQIRVRIDREIDERMKPGWGQRGSCWR